MQRRKALSLITGLGGALFLGVPASAQSLSDSVISQLRQQGYRDFLVEQTWLGRTRIVGIRGKTRREIVIDQRTGELLRDMTSGEDRTRIRDDRSGGRPGRPDRPDADDDDDADDRDDDRGDDDDDDDDDSGGRGRGRGGDNGRDDDRGGDDDDGGGDDD